MVEGRYNKKSRWLWESNFPFLLIWLDEPLIFDPCFPLLVADDIEFSFPRWFFDSTQS